MREDSCPSAFRCFKQFIPNFGAKGDALGHAAAVAQAQEEELAFVGAVVQPAFNRDFVGRRSRQCFRWKYVVPCFSPIVVLAAEIVPQLGIGAGADVALCVRIGQNSS